MQLWSFLQVCALTSLLLSASARGAGMPVVWGITNVFSQAAMHIPPDMTNIVAVGAGVGYNLALQTDGRVVAWGRNDYGQTNQPPDLTNVVLIDGGMEHCLAVRENRTVSAWGRSESGQINVPAELTNVVAVAAGVFHSLALKADGTVVGWGGLYDEAFVPTGLSNVVAIAAGYQTSFALKGDGSLAVWGSRTNTPPGLTNVVAVSPSSTFHMALQADGYVVGWNGTFGDWTNQTGVAGISGGWDYGVLLFRDGHVMSVNEPRPTVPPPLTNAFAVVAGRFHFLALTGTPSEDPVLSAPVCSGTTFRASVNTVRGNRYALGWKNSLEEPFWKMVSPIAGDDSTQVLVDPNANGSQRFYRALRLP